MTEAQRLADQIENSIGSVRPAEAAAELRRLEAECEALRTENVALLDVLWKSSGDDKETVECYLHSVGLALDKLHSRKEKT